MTVPGLPATRASTHGLVDCTAALRTDNADRWIALSRCRPCRFPPAADCVANGFVGLALHSGLGDRGHEDLVIEPRANPIDDVVVEGRIRLQFVPHGTEFWLLLGSVSLLRRLGALSGRFLTE